MSGIGNFKHHGNFYYDVGRKLFNGLTRLGHNVYFLSDRDTSRAATIFGRQWFAQTMQPDFPEYLP